jgi:hypothetical protein
LNERLSQIAVMVAAPASVIVLPAHAPVLHQMLALRHGAEWLGKR